MASSLPVDDDDIVAGINVTPLVDITLVLLIIFMVTAKLVVQQGIPMDLPNAASASATQTIFTVSVDANGKLYANGAPVTEPELRAAAKRALADNRELRTVVQAAGAARHDVVIRAVDDLREAGIVKIAFAADRTPARAEAQ